MIKFFFNEQWKEVHFEKGALKLRYAVSNYGRVVSFSDKIENGRLLKGNLIGGYPAICVRPFGKSKTFYIHRLVAEYFLDKPSEECDFVVHVDFNKENNVSSNLRWMTEDEKNTHNIDNPFVKAGRAKRHENNKHRGHKLTSTQVIRIKKMLQNPNRKKRMKMIAKEFGISEMQLYRIKSGENWGHIKID